MLAVFCTLAVVAATVAVYWPAASFPFLNWDDPINFVDNRALVGGAGPLLSWAWSTTLLGVYQPVSWMVAGVVCALQGGVQPRGLHIANILLHAASAGLVCMLTARILRIARPRAGAAVWPIAALAALMFGYHPLRVETVAWATAQPYALCVFFSLLTVLCYVWAHEPGRSVRARGALLVLAFIFCAAAMLSKAAGLALPVVLFVLDVWPLRRLDKPGRVLIEKIPFFALSLGAGVLAIWASGQVEPIRAEDDLNLLARCAQAAYGFAFGVVKTVVPLDLSPYYALPKSTNPLELRFIASAGLVVCATIVAFALRRRWPALLAAWVCYLALILPSAGVVSHGLQLAADRYTYLSCVAWPIVIAAGLLVASQSAGRGTRAALFGFAAVAAVALGALTIAQLRHWSSSESLWRHAIACAPNDAFAWKSLARDLGAQGRHAESIGAYKQALEMDADHPDAWYDLGNQLAAVGRLNDAVRAYQEAIKRKPADADAHYNLGLALKSLGRLDEAAAQYRLALKVQPSNALAYNNLGNVYFAQRRFGDAERAYLAAIDLDGKYAEPHNGLGLVMLQLGRPAEAVPHFERALSIRPDYVDARRNLEYARQQAGAAR